MNTWLRYTGRAELQAVDRQVLVGESLPVRISEEYLIVYDRSLAEVEGWNNEPHDTRTLVEATADRLRRRVRVLISHGADNGTSQ